MKNIFISMYLMSFLFIGAFSAQAANLKDAFSTGEGKPLSDMAGEKGAGYADPGVYGFEDKVSAVIYTLLSILGIVFLVLLIYGGFLWMTARGSEQQVEKAKDVIFTSTVGLIIILSAYVVSYFVLSKLTEGVLT